MPRPSQSREKREQYLPVLAEVFAQLGYRRATTAALAGRLDIRENQLYRIWPDKKAMFIDTIGYVYAQSMAAWRQVIDQRPAAVSPAAALRDYLARHYGESRMYRIAFAGLSETDDPDVRAALRQMYRRFHGFLMDTVFDADEQDEQAAAAAWLLVGAGVMCDISRELNMLSGPQRETLIVQAANAFVDGSG